MPFFLTRVSNSLVGVTFLVPCLLACLACTTPTPFPVDSLEEGMTPETVRVEFGEPESVKHEWHWGSEPTPRLVIRWHYEARRPVVLYFEADELVRWVEIGSEIRSEGVDVSKTLKEYQEQQRHWQRMKDIGDHKQGH